MAGDRNDGSVEGSVRGGTEGGLDFERADYSDPAVPAMSCASCKREIQSLYFSTGSTAVCESCRHGIEAHLAQGAGTQGPLRALLFGVGAGIAGAVGWSLITMASGYQIGLVAIAVGWGVGSAVRVGSGGFGGKLYQFIAVALTYLAIISTYVPVLLDSMSARAVSAEDGAVADDEWSMGEATAERAPERTPTLILVALVTAAVVPIVTLTERPISGLIIGFALYEAWRRNKRAMLQFEGPFRVGEGGGV